MSRVIDIQNDAGYPLGVEQLQQAVEQVLTLQDAPPDACLTIVVTDDATVQALNVQYRGIDAPTDVLSFPAEALPEELQGNEPPYLGDVILAYPYALVQAEQEKHPIADSLALLVIHGTLHLLGYDHDTPEHRVAMWQAQDTALRTLGIPLEIVPALEGHKGDAQP